MKLVIDIPEKNKALLDSGEADGSVRKSILLAVSNGTPLPENHGRLVDVSDLLKSMMKYMDGDKSLGQCIDDTSTVIEASEVRE